MGFKDNILTDIAWIKTDSGLKTIKETLENWKNINLDIDVPGYEYGAQFRFLMTIFALLVNEAGGNAKAIDHKIIEKVFTKLEPSVHLFDAEDPFLQLSLKYANRKEIFEDNSRSVLKHPNKLNPAEASETQMRFWGLEETLSQNLDLATATRLLVSAYFYRSGGNGDLDGRTPKNGASALRYAPPGKVAPATEIIPTGSSLFETLCLSTPKELCTGEGLFPNWADREGVKSKELSRLWLWTWNTNAFFVKWSLEDEDNLHLKSVGIGGSPKEWWPSSIFVYGDKEQWKKIASARDELDPLYFYRQDSKTGEWKMRYLHLGGEPDYFITRWNADKCFADLSSKWLQNLDSNQDNIINITFLEHATSATAMAFVIRHSKVIEGYRDELLPKGDPDRISEVYGSILEVRSKLLGFFTQKGTMNRISNMRSDVERYYWAEIGTMLPAIAQGDLKLNQVKDYSIKSAIKALNYVAPLKSTINIENRLKAEDILRGLKNGTKK